MHETRTRAAAGQSHAVTRISTGILQWPEKALPTCWKFLFYCHSEHQRMWLMCRKLCSYGPLAYKGRAAKIVLCTPLCLCLLMDCACKILGRFSTKTFNEGLLWAPEVLLTALQQPPANKRWLVWETHIPAAAGACGHQPGPGCWWLHSNNN